MSGTIMAIGTARTNADLIVDCFDLCYLRVNDMILDPTYGNGRFWTKIPIELPNLHRTDLHPRHPDVDCDDFTALSWADEQFDAVVFDPPYKLNGTPSQGGPASSDGDYGVAEAATWQERMDLCQRGIGECARVVKRRGVLLVKCQDQVSSGAVRWQTFEFRDEAARHGCVLIDMLHLVGAREQPAGRIQRHARRNYSTLMVFRKG